MLLSGEAPSNVAPKLTTFGTSFLRAPESLTIIPGSGMGLRWQHWLGDFEEFMKGSQITNPEQHLIALRNLVGKEVGQQIIKELPPDIVKSYQEVCKRAVRIPRRSLSTNMS